MKQREHFYDWTFTVSIQNLDNQIAYIEDAKMDLPGLAEILSRFLDISDKAFKDFTTTMYENTCDSYLIQGAKGTDDPWVVIVKKNPDPLLALAYEHQGFWKKLLKGKTW